jgi:multiple sugar transport system substrate-binding protein
MLGKRVMIPVSIVLAAALTSGCSASKQSSVEQQSPKAEVSKVEAPKGPITLKVATVRAVQSFEDITKVIRKKYPNVTLEIVEYKYNEQFLTNMIATGNAPDIIDDATTNIPLLLDLDFPLDLEPIVKKQNYNMSQVDAGVIESIRSYNGKLLMMPVNLTAPVALFYNKDIFDRFGVSYPKVGNTWDEDIELAKRLSRSENGISYRGLSAGNIINRMATQMSLNYIDPATGKAVISSNEGWKKMFGIWKNIYGIPNNYPAGSKFGNGIPDFVKVRNLAMFPHFLSLIQEKNAANFEEAAKSGLNWGATTWPAFKENPGVAMGGISWGFMITKTNKYPEFSLELIMNLLSDEGQIDIAGTGTVPAVTKPELRQYIYKDDPLINQIPKETLTAIFNTKEPKPYSRSKYDTQSLNIVSKYMHEYLEQNTDLNTVLRKADEEIDKYVLEKSSIKK